MGRHLLRALLLILTVAVIPAMAQTTSATTGTITGVVSDSSGGTLPGVTVNLSGASMMGAQSAVTAEDGAYRFISIPPGEYKVSFELPGFSTITRDAVRITANFTATINVTMGMAALQENPQEALATLAQIYLGQNNVTPQPAAPQGQSQGVQPDVMQLLEQHLAPLRQQNEQLQAQLYGYMANNQLEREWKGLEGRDPRMASDPSLRARVSQVAAERRLPLDDAYKLATYEEVQQRAEQAAAEARTRVMRQFIPSLGGGSRPGDGGQAPPVDSNALFEKSYAESLKELGYID